jgi:hypothetical protein
MDKLHYRDLIVIAVLGERPAIGATVADPKRLDELSATLAQAEAGKQMLCAKQYGSPDMAIDSIVRLVPDAPKGK